MTIGGRLDECAEHFPSREALVYTDRKLRYSYQRLKEGCDRVACGLIRIGVRTRDRVGIWAGNHPEWLVLQLALAKLGAALVPIPLEDGARALAEALRRAEAKALILEAGSAEVVKGLAPELVLCPRGQLHADRLPSLRSVVTLGEDRHRGMYHFKDLIDLAERIPRERLHQIQSTVRPDETALLSPRGAVRRSHQNLLEAAAHLVESSSITADDRICLAAPFYEPAGFVDGLLLALVGGATLVPLYEIDAERAVAAVTAERCTVFAGRPELLSSVEASALPSLRVVLRRGR